jgi:extracellular factor (EF) 3-hydroxypalmitic acid methyl ester biosynthesis protein
MVKTVTPFAGNGMIIAKLALSMEQISTATIFNMGSTEPLSMVSFKTSQGLEGQGTVTRVGPQSVTFEVYSPESILRLSEVLTTFNVYAGSRPIYSATAIVSSLISTGRVTICEVSLASSLLDLYLFPNGNVLESLPAAFECFLERWQKFYKILPEFKLAVADLQNFLEDLQLWLEQIEVGGRAMPVGERREKEREIVKRLPALSALSAMFERFEEAAQKVPEELAAVHRKFCHRLLHPLLLCSPFMHRIFTKPLGYAGDYEMIDMIVRNDCEGNSLFAKVLHAYILDQAPARSVRNRVHYFSQKFVEESLRLLPASRPARFLSLGCGPAREVQNFIAESPLADRASFHLLDFNEETLQYAGQRLGEVRRQHQRQTEVKLIRQSVHQLLKGTGEQFLPEARHDMIYCSGLYDYLSDRICRRLNGYLYNRLAAGGVMIVTNFDSYNPIRNIQESVFDWFLIYRNGRQLAGLAPEQAKPEDCAIRADPTGCNVFLEVRKPLNHDRR